MSYLSKYGAARKIRIPLVKRGVADHAVSGDWTPAAGDVKISKDGGTAANVTNLPTAIAMGNSTVWEFSLTTTEMSAAQINVTIADSSTKAIEDDGFDIETYGNASAQHAVDLSDSVRAGLTALPNVASGSAGAIVTSGTGTAQIATSSGQVLLQSGTGTGQVSISSGVVSVNVTQYGGSAGTFASGRPEVNLTHAKGTAITATGGIPSVNTAQWNGVAPNNLVSGRVDATVGANQAGVITAAAFATDAIDANALKADAATEIATAVLGTVVETNGSITLKQAQSIKLGVLAGVTSGGGNTFKDPSGTSTRVVATTDGSNNRTAISLTPSS